MAEKPGDSTRDQLEPSMIVAKLRTVEWGNLISSLALALIIKLIGGTFPKCKSLIADKRLSSLTIHAIRIDEGYTTTNSPVSLHPPQL